MATTGINDMAASTDVIAAERISRELSRVPSKTASISAAGVQEDASSASEDEKDKLKAQDGLAAVPAVDYEKENEAEDESEPYDVLKGEQFALKDLPDEPGTGFTFLAASVGSMLGLLIAASNVYLGLKTGFTFAASLFGALGGCAILKALERAGVTSVFGPRLNTTVQSAATAAGSLTGMFVAAIPAAYQLKLLKDPVTDFGRLITFALCSAFFGAAMAIPLRKFYILRQRLVFPTPTATALTIRAIHAPGGDVAMKLKTRCLVWTFGITFVFCVVRQYAPGILMDWHIGYWLYSWGWKAAIQAENYNWLQFELTPAFTGAGILSGMNASYSFFFGCIVSWAVIAPATVATGLTRGKPSPIEPLVIRYSAVKFDTPRYWLLWVGVALMLFHSIAELAVASPAIYRAIRVLVIDSYRSFRGKSASGESSDEFPDPVPAHQQTPGWAWIGVWVLSAVMTILVCTLQFHMFAGNVILAVLLAFIFAFVAVSSSGTTDVNPTGTVAKMSQLIVGGALKGQGRTMGGEDAIRSAQLENLIAGSIASSAASHCVDMLGDLKTGHLLRASPRAQFQAQLFGSLVAVPFSVAMFVLFAKAYPCVIDAAVFDEGSCFFSAPAVVSWRFVSDAVTRDGAIPFSAGMTGLGLGLFAVIVVFVKHLWIPKKYHVWVPNMNAVGLAFTLTQLYYAEAMVIGATASMIWARKNPKSWELYAYTLAAGLLVGEGLAGVLNAVLSIAGVDGDTYGSKVGIPPF